MDGFADDFEIHRTFVKTRRCRYVMYVVYGSVWPWVTVCLSRRASRDMTGGHLRLWREFEWVLIFLE